MHNSFPERRTIAVLPLVPLSRIELLTRMHTCVFTRDAAKYEIRCDRALEERDWIVRPRNCTIIAHVFGKPWGKGWKSLTTWRWWICEICKTRLVRLRLSAALAQPSQQFDMNSDNGSPRARWPTLSSLFWIRHEVRATTARGYDIAKARGRRTKPLRIDARAHARATSLNT